MLTPGSYRVSARANGYAVKTIGIDVQLDKPFEINFALNKLGVVRVSSAIFVALVFSCGLVFLLLLFLLSRMCHWRRRGRRYPSKGFELLRNLENEDETKISGEEKERLRQIVLAESELSDEIDEEEVVFSDSENLSDKLRK